MSCSTANSRVKDFGYYKIPGLNYARYSIKRKQFMTIRLSTKKVAGGT